MSAAPLSINLNTSSTKTAVPMIADGTWAKFRLVKLAQDTVEGKGDVLIWEYELVDPVPGSEGQVIRPGEFGSKFFERIQLYAKPDAKDPKWFEKKISTRIDALLGTGDPGNIKGKPARPDLSAAVVPLMVGQTILAKMKVKTGEYTGNEISDVKFPGDVVTA